MLFRIVTCFFLILSIARAEDNGELSCSNKGQDLVSLIICIDDDVRELEQLRERIQTRIFYRIEIKYEKKDLERAKVLKAKTESTIKIWEQYRASYCDMESIHLDTEDGRDDFVKQCILSLTRTRIEDLRLLQINI